jgi:oxazoline/thiazoline synthase
MCTNERNLNLSIVKSKNYRINARFKLNVVDSSRAILSSEEGGHILQCPNVIKVLTKIEASGPSRAELMASCQEYGSMRSLLEALHLLESRGYIDEALNRFPSEQVAFWESLGFDQENLQKALNRSTVNVHAIGGVALAPFVKACEVMGIRLSDSPQLTIVLTSSYLDPRLAQFNKDALRTQIPWMLVCPLGTKPLIGPILEPGREGAFCWECLRHRMALNDKVSGFYKMAKPASEDLLRPQVAHPLATEMVTNRAVFDATTWLYRGAHQELTGGIFQMDILNGGQNYHRASKRPQCKVCGEPAIKRAPPEPIRIRPNSVVQSNYGGYRTVSPEMTYEKFKHLVSPLTGIVPYLKAFPAALDAPVFNYSSGRNVGIQANSEFWLNIHERSSNGGKGKTEIQAKVGALCEAVERFCMVYPGETYIVSGSSESLVGAIRPNDCMLYSQAQFERREGINAEAMRLHAYVPDPFDFQEEMAWTPVWSLSEKNFKYLPTCFCYAQYPQEDGVPIYAYPDSNGCAAGNTLEEAMLQGFLELVERDAAAIWWYNRIQRPSVNLRSSKNPYLYEVVAYYSRIERSLEVLDLTTDLGIPVFCAISHNLIKDQPDQILYAFGAHVDANIALERAVIELNQLLPLTKTTNGNYQIKDRLLVEWLNDVRLESHSYLQPLRQGELNIQHDTGLLCPATVHDSLDFCLEVARKSGLETLVLDLTQPDVGLPVVKVMVPGLRHMWRRTAPGRLYEVPVRMGWLKNSLLEEELNPYSILT